MIALNREMPKHCLECPCLQTLIIPEDSAEYWIRYCAAGDFSMYITTSDEYNNNEGIQFEWIHFLKPEKCPLIEIGGSLK